MDLTNYHTFMVLVKTRHFGKTAEQLHISQSTVSFRIKQLETYYDTSLFVRARNDITLTFAGERLIEYAELISETSFKSQVELSIEKGKLRHLKIAAPSNRVQPKNPQMLLF